MAVMRCEISNAPPDPCAAIAAAHFGFSSLLRYSSRSVWAVPPLAAMGGGGRDGKGLSVGGAMLTAFGWQGYRLDKGSLVANQ